MRNESLKRTAGGQFAFLGSRDSDTIGLDGSAGLAAAVVQLRRWAL